MELNVRATISQSYFSNNNATRYGTIYLGVDSFVSLVNSNVTSNIATYGGFLYGYRSSLNVSHSTFIDNVSHKLGGCFYLRSSTANFQDTIVSQNNASEDGGGMFATMTTILHIIRTSITYNRAENRGGGIALLFGSLLLCSNCTFEGNIAKQGGGCYTETNVQQNVIVQMRNSRLQSNRALDYGGGMVVKVFGLRTNNCSNINVPCSRVLLLNTSFIDNFAHQSGAALVVTRLDGVLVSCLGEDERYSHDFMSRFYMRTLIEYHELKKLNSTIPCPSWHGNKLSHDAKGQAIGTFGQTLNITIDSTDEHQLVGDADSGFVLSNVSSGQELPRMVLTTLNNLVNVCAPTLHERDAITLEAKGFLQQPFSFSFENGVCTITGIVGFVQHGNYTIQVLPRSDDILEATHLTLVVRECKINEESTQNETLCETCGEASYNFNSFGGGKCTPCPMQAKCTGEYIVPDEGYWHKSPCHDKVKKCIIEEACKYQNRSHNLTLLSQDFTDCNFNDTTTLHKYEEAQCSEGYKGRLCGSCSKSYGLSLDFECLKCGSMMLSTLQLLLIVLFLFVTTTIAINGTLPIASRCLVRHHAMTSPQYNVNIAPLEEETSTQSRVMSQQGSNVPPTSTNDEEVVSSSLSSQLARGITIAHGSMVETWKILVNFLQVNSTATTMNVKWTSKILGFFKVLNLIGSATLNAISRPIDCLVVSFSNAARAILRYLFSLFVPTMVIIMLSLYWGYQSLVKRRAERWYFWRRLLLTMITVTYVTYFDVTQVAVRVFNYVSVYDNINPFSNSFTRYWIVDTSIEYFKSTHIVLICISLVILATISIGFPLACSIALLRNRNEVNASNSRAHEVLGLLCGPFKDRFVYWECITMIKKAMLSLIIVFSYSLGNQVQGILISIVLAFFLALHSACYPFKEEFNILNYYEIGSLTTSCITYTLVELFNVERLSESERGLVSIAVIILNGGFVMFMAFTIARNFVAFAKASLKSDHVIDVDDEISWFKTIRIYFSSWWFGRLSSTQN